LQPGRGDLGLMFGRKPFSWRLLLLRNRDCHIHGVDFGDDADIPE